MPLMRLPEASKACLESLPLACALAANLLETKIISLRRTLRTLFREREKISLVDFRSVDFAFTRRSHARRNLRCCASLRQRLLSTAPAATPLAQRAKRPRGRRDRPFHGWTTSQPQNARDATRRAIARTTRPPPRRRAAPPRADARNRALTAPPPPAQARATKKPHREETMATTATPSASRLRALTDVTNIEKNAQQAKPSRTPAPKVSLGGNDSVELFFDAAETPRVTQTEVKEFACTPHAPRVSTTPILATPDERLLTNAAAEEALTAAWIAAQTAEIEALRALVRRQRHEKEALIANGAGPYATSVQRAARGRLARNRAAALWRALAVSQTRRRGAVPRRAFLELRAATIVVQNPLRARGSSAHGLPDGAGRFHYTPDGGAGPAGAQGVHGAQGRVVGRGDARRAVPWRGARRRGRWPRPRRSSASTRGTRRALVIRGQIRAGLAPGRAAALRAVSGTEPAEGHDGSANSRLLEEARARSTRRRCATASRLL